ncbi:MAG: hypothetical protein V4467_02690 [Patescibacteria group bacterium]
MSGRCGFHPDGPWKRVSSHPSASNYSLVFGPYLEVLHAHPVDEPADFTQPFLSISFALPGVREDLRIQVRAEPDPIKLCAFLAHNIKAARSGVVGTFFYTCCGNVPAHDPLKTLLHSFDKWGGWCEEGLPLHDEILLACQRARTQVPRQVLPVRPLCSCLQA